MAAVRSEPVGASEPVALHLVRPAEEQPRERRRIDAEVEQRAAACRQVEQPMGRVVGEPLRTGRRAR